MPKDRIIPFLDALDAAIKTLEQEPTTKNDLAHNLCDSCTNIGCEFQSGIVRTKCAFYMPQQELQKGHWIYDKSIDNWRCSECNETPKTMGYVGTDDFMTEHFKFCNHCGAKMESEG